MKNIYLTLSLLTLPQFGLAQLCVPSSPEMKLYQEQSSWAPHQYRDQRSVGSINGFLDSKNNFYFADLSRGGGFKAKIEVDKNNSQYDEFFTSCSNSKDRGQYLAMMRRKESNRYFLNLTYLPTPVGFKNSPFSNQKLEEYDTRVSVEFGSQSVTLAHAFDSEQVRMDVTRSIQSQISKQKNLGVIQLDLTKMDDVVCDLIQGNVQIRISKTLTSNGPLIKQEKKIDDGDLSTIHREINSRLQKEKFNGPFLFFAGRVTAKLESEKKISVYNENLGYEILKKIMKKDSTGLNPQSEESLRCATDQMQSYEKSLALHYLDIQIKAPSLDEVKSGNTEE